MSGAFNKNESGFIEISSFDGFFVISRTKVNIASIRFEL